MLYCMWVKILLSCAYIYLFIFHLNIEYVEKLSEEKNETDNLMSHKHLLVMV